jgi:hypothetical protein
MTVSGWTIRRTADQRRPKAAEGGPEEPVAGVEAWPRSLAFKHGNLLTESKDLQGGISS